jgi:hypothetical protein
MECSFFVDPNAGLSEQLSSVPEDFGAFTEADECIFNMLETGPILQMTLVNKASRLLPYRSKRQKLAIKWSILKRIGELIRAGKLRRIKRKYVRLP